MKDLEIEPVRPIVQASAATCSSMFAHPYPFAQITSLPEKTARETAPPASSATPAATSASNCASVASKGVNWADARRGTSVVARSVTDIMAHQWTIGLAPTGKTCGVSLISLFLDEVGLFYGDATMGTPRS